MIVPDRKHQELVYQDKVQKIYRVSADFGAFEKEYFVREAGERSGVVVVNDGAVLLVRQYRLVVDRLSWEIPGGGIDDSETPEEAVLRECLEETGIMCRGLEPLIHYQPGLDTLKNPTWLFHTNEFEVVSPPVCNPGEVQAVEWVSLEKCFQMIREGEMLDAFTLIALFSYRFLKA